MTAILLNETSTNPTTAISKFTSEETTSAENDHETSTQSNTVTITQPYSSTESTLTHSTGNVSVTNTHSTEGTSGFEMSSTSILTTVASTHSSTINQSTTDVTPVDTCYSKTTLYIVSGAFGGVILLVLVISMICCLLLRHKWRSKLVLERERTDIWSMATFNNTIVNDNFMDYQLASPRTFPPKSSSKSRRKSSGYSEHSVHIVDPFSRRPSRNNCFEYVDFRKDSLGKRGSSDQECTFDDSTLRRNTYSAPSGLDTPSIPVATQRHIDHIPSNRERALTFSAGKKHKVDKHVLLTHEEYIEDDKMHEYGNPLPNHSSFTTEL